MTIFLTGASGFVGLNLAETLLGRGEDVTTFSAGPLPDAARRAFASLPGRLTEVEGDVLDDEALNGALAQARARVVIHGAALTPGPDHEPKVFRRTLEVNVLGVVGVLEAARAQDVERLVHLSSGSVFGENAKAAPLLDEALPHPRPQSVYAISKYAGERAALRFGTLHGFPVTVARLGAVFGPWEYATGVRETLSPLLGATLLALRGEEAVLSEAVDQDWIYVRDVAEAVAALAQGETPPHDLYHIGSGQAWSVADWCRELAARRPGFQWRVAEEGQSSNVEVYGATVRSPLATERLFKDLGIRARFGLLESLVDYLDWFETSGRDLFLEQGGSS